ncbi:MAG: KOW domain-containing RNA-binding protein [Fretibacterium sp.]|nr:KOW domain-containing RNA-binding protein [Fretibacterium sp.]
MDKSDGSLELLPALYSVGQVVLSRQGKDRGKFYVVVGLEKDRLALADGERFNVSRPKRKNPRHVQRTSRCVAELAKLIEAKRDIDHGRFCQILAGIRDVPAEE